MICAAYIFSMFIIFYIQSWHSVSTWHFVPYVNYPSCYENTGFFFKVQAILVYCKKIKRTLILSLWKSVKYYSPLVSGIYPIINLLLKKIFFFWPHYMGYYFSHQGSNLGCWQWKRWVLTTGPPGNCLVLFFFLPQVPFNLVKAIKQPLHIRH